jgi:DNA repair protein RadC
MDRNPKKHLSLRELPKEDRPQERLERLGPTPLTDRELLAMLVRSGNAKIDVLAIADELIKQAGSMTGLLRWDVSDFQRIKGIGKVKALQLSTQVEIAKRMMRGTRTNDLRLDEPHKVWEYLYPEVRSDSVEKVWVLSLDRKNKLIRAEPVTSGTATGSLVHPREVFRPAIRYGATAIILAHNHPSGDPTPSTADLRVTKKIFEASKTVDLDMLDHVIIGETENCPNGLGYYSFSDAGHLP